MSIYASVKVLDDLSLREYIWENKIPQNHPFDRMFLHATIMSSKNYKRDIKDFASNAVYIAKPVKFIELPLGPMRVLAIELECESLKARHNEFRKVGLESRYPSYIPHISLSYNMRDFDYSKLTLPEGNILLGQEKITCAGNREYHPMKTWKELQDRFSRVLEKEHDSCVLA